MRTYPERFGPFLEHHIKLETLNIEESEEATTRAWIPHRLTFAHPREKFYQQVGHVQLTDIGVCFVKQQGRIHALAGPSPSSFLISLRAEGASDYQIAGKTISFSEDRAVVQSPGYVAQNVTSEYQEIMGLVIGEAAVIREMEGQLNNSLGNQVLFAPGMDLRSAVGVQFRRMAIRLFRGLDELGRNLPGKQLWARQMEKALVSLLIEGHRHNYTRLMHHWIPASPWQVRAAEEFIRAHPEQELSLGDLARIAGVSARTLQFSFQKHRSYSPMQFLRMTRLERVHAELLHPGDSRSVTEIATKWGFQHLGRFAAEYRSRFSEAPSASLYRGLRR